MLPWEIHGQKIIFILRNNMLQKKWLQFILPFIIFVLGIVSYLLLQLNREPPKPSEVTTLIRPVEVLKIKKEQYQIPIITQGITKAKDELILAFELKGRVSWLNPNFVEGKRVNKGELLAKIDARDYEIQKIKSKANVTKAQYEFQVVQAEKEKALQELKYLKKLKTSQKKSDSLEINRLARYEPQIRNAKANLKSAKAELELAKLNLARTKLAASFTGFLKNITLATGQIISSGEQIGTLISETPILINVSIPLSELEWVNMEYVEYSEMTLNIPVKIKKKIGSLLHVWNGKVVRRLQEMDAAGSLAKLRIEINNIESNYGMILPLELLVEVEIQGKKTDPIIEIPIEALQNEDQVWLVSSDNTLKKQKVTIIRRFENQLLISEGINEGDLLVVSRINQVTEGIQVKITKVFQSPLEESSK